MSALTFRLKAEPPVRLDAGALIPAALAKLSLAEIQRLVLRGGRRTITVGDVFTLSGSDAGDLRFGGDCERLDYLGAGLDGGRMLVEGNVGVAAGSRMKGGLLAIAGNAGAYAGAGLEDGTIKIEGHAGEHAGGAMPGDTHGMRGGFLLVRGNAGMRAGDRMRRGTMVVEGGTGDYPGSRMLAGTLAIFGAAGLLPGYMMRRGSILLRQAVELGPTFLDAGMQDFVWLRVLSRYLKEKGVRDAEAVAAPVRRHSGDMAAIGKGEILVAVA